MVTNAEEPKGARTTREDVAERAAELAQDMRRGSAYLLTGREAGSVRRNLLYVTAFALIIVGLPLLALIPLLLLALTDAVILP